MYLELPIYLFKGLSTVGDLATELRSSIPYLYITVKFEMFYYNDKKTSVIYN
jgi:hypothetical protein